MKNIEVKYWISLVLSLACAFMIYDTISVFPYDLYSIIMGQFINIPLGIVSLIVSIVIQKKEVSKIKLKTYITSAGIILGLITAVISIVLYNIGMALR